MPRAVEILEQASNFRPVFEVVGALQVAARGDTSEQQRQRALGPMAGDEEFLASARERHVNDTLPLVGQTRLAIERVRTL